MKNIVLLLILQDINISIYHIKRYILEILVQQRLLAGLLSGLGIECVLSGDASIGKRPMNRVLRPLKLMNANINGIENNYTPLIIKPSAINGINYQMEVASAQVKSAILFASLFSKDASQITELDISRNHTETMFKHYQIPIQVNQK